MVAYILVIMAVLLASVAQVLLKISANIKHATLIREYLNIRVIGAYFLLAISMLLNIYAMSLGVKVKEVSSLEAVSYLFVPVLSFLVLGEKLSKNQIVAVACIITGVVVFFISF